MQHFEMEVSTKALKILISDNAHDLFIKIFDFVQAKSTVQSACCDDVILVTAVSAKRCDNLRLPTTVNKVRMDVFMCVKKNIDDMIIEQVSQKDKTENKDFGEDVFNTRRCARRRRSARRLTSRPTIEAAVIHSEQDMQECTRTS
eukprot:10922222-Heterocapsa_arctica.AAC.1